MNDMIMDQKNEFLWGTATSAFQIEGSPLADGAAPSDWYAMSHMPGIIRNSDTADIACDHYHRWGEDIQLMSELGLTAYRFSMAWPRIFNTSTRVNAKGLDFYDRLINGLLAADITPFVTLFHWDMPKWLDDKGGWLYSDAPEYFAEYAHTVFEHFGDRVNQWITINEPLVYFHSYITEFHWPFRKNAYRDFLCAVDNELRGHRLAVDLCRKEKRGDIGIVISYCLGHPTTDSKEDLLAASRHDGIRNRWLLDRVMYGKYPKDIMELYGDHVPPQCREPLDIDTTTRPSFLGLNYYTSSQVQFDKTVEVFQYKSPETIDELQPVITLDAEGMHTMLQRVDRDYGPIDLFISENGFMEYEQEGFDPIDDPARVDFLKQYLPQVMRCVEDGLPLKGYFYWSFLDNFEWRWGFDRQFGLVHIDRKTQDRRLKASARYYRDFISSFIQ